MSEKQDNPHWTEHLIDTVAEDVLCQLEQETKDARGWDLADRQDVAVRRSSEGFAW
jgi:hypothetical protein